jgi:hypothetical protein
MTCSTKLASVSSSGAYTSARRVGSFMAGLRLAHAEGREREREEVRRVRGRRRRARTARQRGAEPKRRGSAAESKAALSHRHPLGRALLPGPGAKFAADAHSAEKTRLAALLTAVRQASSACADSRCAAGAERVARGRCRRRTAPRPRPALGGFHGRRRRRCLASLPRVQPARQQLSSTTAPEGTESVYVRAGASRTEASRLRALGSASWRAAPRVQARPMRDAEGAGERHRGVQLGAPLGREPAAEAAVAHCRGRAESEIGVLARSWKDQRSTTLAAARGRGVALPAAWNLPESGEWEEALPQRTSPASDEQRSGRHTHATSSFLANKLCWTPALGKCAAIQQGRGHAGDVTVTRSAQRGEGDRRRETKGTHKL